MTLQPGSRLGPYEVVALLGRGGMGEVWRARDEVLSRTVAVKVLKAEYAADPSFLERFRAEAQVHEPLRSPVWRESWAITEALLQQMHQQAIHHGAGFLLWSLALRSRSIRTETSVKHSSPIPFI